MKVRRLEMEHFTTHAHTVLELPSAGVVLITGPNGSGKSSFIEAVSWGLWGKTLRGADPWVEGSKCQVTVTLGGDPPDWIVERTRVEKALRWASAVGGEWTSHGTATKAQEALAAIVGSWDVWRRSSVFSSADAAHFSTATDGERKRFLEMVLGLDRFDPALDACRLDLRRSSVTAATLASEAQVVQAKLDGARTRLADAQEAVKLLPGVMDVPAAERRLAELGELAQDGERDIAGVRAKLQVLSSRGGAFAERARQMEEKLRTLQVSLCPTCGQSIPGDIRLPYKAECDRAEADLKQARAAYVEANTQAAGDLQEMEEELQVLRQQSAELRTSLKRATEDATRRTSATLVVETAARDATLCLAALEKKQMGKAAAEVEVAELSASEKVLGLKGVRAQVLGRALSGLELAANAWLARIAAPGTRITLKPYTEKKSGGVSDSLGMEITGVGGGQGYRASSGGERRRLDVALMLALADVAVASHGHGGSTLWFDECFDALDADGVNAVASVLADLSRDRAVVVVSHSDLLAGVLQPVLRLHVADGRIQAR